MVELDSHPGSLAPGLKYSINYFPHFPDKLRHWRLLDLLQVTRLELASSSIKSQRVLLFLLRQPFAPDTGVGALAASSQPVMFIPRAHCVSGSLDTPSTSVGD